MEIDDKAKQKVLEELLAMLSDRSASKLKPDDKPEDKPADATDTDAEMPGEEDDAEEMTETPIEKKVEITAGSDKDVDDALEKLRELLKFGKE